MIILVYRLRLIFSFNAFTALTVTGKRLKPLLGQRQSSRYAVMLRSTFWKCRRVAQMNTYLPLDQKGRLLIHILKKRQKMLRFQHKPRGLFMLRLHCLNLDMFFGLIPRQFSEILLIMLQCLPGRIRQCRLSVSPAQQKARMWSITPVAALTALREHGRVVKQLTKVIMLLHWEFYLISLRYTVSLAVSLTRTPLVMCRNWKKWILLTLKQCFCWWEIYPLIWQAQILRITGSCFQLMRWIRQLAVEHTLVMIDPTMSCNYGREMRKESNWFLLVVGSPVAWYPWPQNQKRRFSGYKIVGAVFSFVMGLDKVNPKVACRGHCLFVVAYKVCWVYITGRK